MALIDCNFFSEVLGLSCSMHVILPQAPRNEIGRARKYPTLWLLHGRSDDHSMWTRQTSIERYADEAGIAVVMPAVGLSWYQDMASGLNYGAFLREELPEIARSFFPLSPHRKDNFIAGLSMGGYGAFLMALSQPEKYAAAASLSGVLDIHERVRKNVDARSENMIRLAFGPASKVRGSDADLFALSEKLQRSEHRPPALYACCGIADFLIAGNREFVAHAKKIGLSFEYEEHPGADHEWGYWDRQIQRVIEWLPIKGGR